MKHSNKKLGKAILALLSFYFAPLVQAQGWPMGYCDPFGYIPVAQAKTSNEVRQTLGLIESDPSKAWKKFSEMFTKGNSDPMVAFGLILSSHKIGKLVDGIETVAERYARFREKQLKKGIKEERDIPIEIMVGYNMGLSIFTQELKTPKELNSIPDLKKISRFYYGTLSDYGVATKGMTREQAIILGGSYFLLHSRPQSRRVLADFSSSHPKDVDIHLMLSRCFNIGSEQRIRGGKLVPVPDNEKRRPDLAKREAILALQLDPKSPVANYWVGRYSMDENPALTKRCWTYFMQTDGWKKTSFEQKQIVEQWLGSH